MTRFHSTRRTAVVVATALATLGGLVLVSTPTSAGAPPSGGAQRQAASLNGCWDADHGKPVLDDLTVSSHAVDVSTAPATLTYTALAHDTGGPGPAKGVRYVTLRVQEFWADSPHPGRADVTTELILQPPGTSTSYSEDYTVPQDAHAMQIRVTRVRIDVKPGGVGTTVDPAAAGFDTTVDVTSTHPDATAPTLADFAISPQPVDVSHGATTVHVTATVADSGTGLDFQYLVVDGVAGVFPNPALPPGHFAADIPVHRWSPAHIHLGLVLADGAHNTRRLTSDQIATAGFDSVIDVTGGTPDHAAPVAHLVSSSPHRVDVRHGQAEWQITLDVHDRSGIRDLSVRSVDPLPRPTVSGASSAPGHHVLSFPVRIGRCVHGPGPLPLKIFVQDNTYRTTTVRIQGPVIVSSDHIAPSVRLHQGPAQHSWVAAFNEPVHGISGASVVASTTTDPADRVTGTWTCFRRTSGTVRTSCRTGQVRRARFVVDGTAKVRSIDFEPNHHLDVLDDNGNPLTHDGLARVRP